MLSCLNVVESEMGGMTAPVSELGSDPAWIARVPKPSVDMIGKKAVEEMVAIKFVAAA